MAIGHREMERGAAGGQWTMVYLRFGEEQSLICTPDAVVLLPNGELRRSVKLNPRDQLVDKDGNAVPIESVVLGYYLGGVHDLATDAPTGSIDGHLLVANGVVIGDYTLETESPASAKKDPAAADSGQVPQIPKPEL